MIKKSSFNLLNFFNGPLMIEAAACQHILGMLNERLALVDVGAKVGPRVAPGGGNNIAVIPVSGVLSYRGGSLMSWLFDTSTYEGIRVDFRRALADPAVATIVFDINSPGGDVQGAFDLVDEIYAARGQKPIYAVANETAYSAAYAIASAADKIYVPRSGGVGSIGILAVHVDQSAADAAEGLTYNIIYAGDKKIDGTSHAPLSDEARTRIQNDVDAMYAIFVDTVARNRGMKAADVRGQQAGIYRGKAAVEAGMADGVLSWNQVMGKIVGKQNKGGNRMEQAMEKIRAIFAERTDLTEAGILAQMGYIPKLADGSLIMTQAEIDAIKEKAVEDARAHVSALNDICTLAGMPQMLPGLIMSGVDVEAAKKAVLDEKAKPPAAVIIGAIGVAASEENPVVAEAKKRANVK